MPFKILEGKIQIDPFSKLNIELDYIDLPQPLPYKLDVKLFDIDNDFDP